MSKTVLVLNTGSSSIKFGLFGAAGADPKHLFAGEVENINDKPRLTVTDMHDKVVLDLCWTSPRKREDTLKDILDWTEQNAGGGGLSAVGHRIVHGGSHFVAPTRLTRETIDELARLTPMAPLHQEACLSPARTLVSLRPELMQSDASIRPFTLPSSLRLAASRSLATTRKAVFAATASMGFPTNSLWENFGKSPLP